MASNYPASLFNALTLVATFGLVGATSAQQVQVPRGDDRTYEDIATFRSKKPYTVDPYVWVYSREFAELYRMPEKWIDDGLKGAYAVAFRMSDIGNVRCGLAGRAENCLPPTHCQIDLYYDNQLQLPWVRSDIVSDVLPIAGLSSKAHLIEANPKVQKRYVSEDRKVQRGVMEGMSIHWAIPPKVHGATWSILYYDKVFQPHIGLIGFRGICPTVPGKAFLHFYDKETTNIRKSRVKRPEDAKAMHTVELTEAFMRRAHEVYVREAGKNRDAWERILEK